MSVNTQVSGNKITVIQASKNLGTVINNQESGNKINAGLKYKKITDVKPTQVDGQMKRTNYMGINDEGMDIFAAKKVDEHFYHQNQYSAQAEIIREANAEIAIQEGDKKRKGGNTGITPLIDTYIPDEETEPVIEPEEATEVTFQDEE